MNGKEGEGSVWVPGSFIQYTLICWSAWIWKSQGRLLPHRYFLLCESGSPLTFEGYLYTTYSCFQAQLLGSQGFLLWARWKETSLAQRSTWWLWAECPCRHAAPANPQRVQTHFLDCAVGQQGTDYDIFHSFKRKKTPVCRSRAQSKQSPSKIPLISFIEKKSVHAQLAYWNWWM